MFELFCELKDESEFYRAFRLTDGSGYMTVHYDMARVQRWCKGRYKVEVLDSGATYESECGLFEHFGLACSHILRVIYDL